MTTRNATASRKLPAPRVSSEDPPAYLVGKDRKAREHLDCSYNTADRIRAYLAAVEPRDCAADSPHYRSGMLLIERVAASAKGIDAPTLKLSPGQGADVLHFIAASDPISPKTWSNDSGITSHLVGLNFILRALEASLRVVGTRS